MTRPVALGHPAAEFTPEQPETRPLRGVSLSTSNHRLRKGLVGNYTPEQKRFYLEVTRGPNGAQVPVPYFLHVQQNQL